MFKRVKLKEIFRTKTVVSGSRDDVGEGGINIIINYHYTIEDLSTLKLCNSKIFVRCLYVNLGSRTNS